MQGVVGFLQQIWVYQGIIFLNFVSRLRFDRIMAISLWPHFLGPPYRETTRNMQQPSTMLITRYRLHKLLLWLFSSPKGRQNYRTLVQALNHQIFQLTVILSNQSTALFTLAVYNHRTANVVQTLAGNIFRDGIPAQRRPPIQVLTGPDVR